jgi:hypothetical protein
MELERTVIGLVAAVLLPYSVPGLRSRGVAAPLAGTCYGGYALGAGALTWYGPLLLGMCALSVWTLTRVVRGDADVQGSPRLFRPSEVRKYTLVPLGLVGSTLLVAVAASAAPRVAPALGSLMMDDETAILTSGFLIATFVGGEVVTHILRPFADELNSTGNEEMTPLRGAGTLIGWLERSFTFVLIVAGRPEAVTVVVAIKALARFPELKSDQKRFAEYFLIGTMSSIGFALLVAAGLRLALGAEALG